MLLPTQVLPSRSNTEANRQYDLRVNYSLAGGDMTNAQIVVDMPRGMIPVSLGAFNNFQGSCSYVDDLSWGARERPAKWSCTFSANTLAVGMGIGLSGQLPIRIRLASFYFTSNEELTPTATFTGTSVPTGATVNAATSGTTTVGAITNNGSFTISSGRRGFLKPTGSNDVHTADALTIALSDTGYGYLGRGGYAEHSLPTGALLLAETPGTYVSSTYSNYEEVAWPRCIYHTRWLSCG